MFDKIKSMVHEHIIPAIFVPPTIETGSGIINQDAINRLTPIIERQIEGIVKDNEFIVMEAQQQEHAFLTSFVEATHLSTTTMTLTPHEAKRALDGESVLVLKYNEEQGKYAAYTKYNVQGMDGRDTDLRVEVIKLFNTTLQALEQRGFNSSKIQSMYQHGMFPDNKIDVLRIKKI